MGTLFGALNSSLSAMEALQNALEVTQNNVSNATTPGYASQTATFVADPLNLSQGRVGGVHSGPIQSSDNRYADQAVQTQNSLAGGFNAQSTALAPLQSLFDVTGQTGVIGALNSLFQSFSAWSATPDSSASQQNVLSQATGLAQQFQSAASFLSQTTTQLNQQIGSTVQQINSLASQIATDNAAIDQGGGTPDPAIQANLESSIESLSSLANTNVIYAANGTATVLLGGQSALVVDSRAYAVQANFSATGSGGNPNAVPDAQIIDGSGNDITSAVTQGTLGGLLNVRNTTLPSLQGDSQQQGALNILAQQVADRVNSILTSGTTVSGAPGTALFTYSNTSPVDVAATLAVSPAITTDALAPANGSGGNGAALELSNLGDSTAPADEINGQTIIQYAAAMASQVGQQVSDAQSGATLHSQLLAQAQSVQTQISGVSLNAEAALVLQLQQGYDAAGKMVSVIGALANTLINMVPTPT